uniref:Uncharacterized protein n=1 Tax=Asparagus officinalis TaxID=4686 RepID=Q2AA85_ASPOF|nr:hypothetical protein 17.t00012 [Asparagus officinalis]
MKMKMENYLKDLLCRLISPLVSTQESRLDESVGAEASVIVPSVYP